MALRRLCDRCGQTIPEENGAPARYFVEMEVRSFKPSEHGAVIQSGRRIRKDFCNSCYESVMERFRERIGEGNE